MARRHDWDVLVQLYQFGYSSVDLGVIFYTSNGAISRGLKQRIPLRKSGMVTLPLSPKQFPAEFNKRLKEMGYYERMHFYYDKVVRLNKAALFLRSGDGLTQIELAGKLGIGKTQIYKIMKSVEPILQANQSLINQGRTAKERDVLAARVLSSLATKERERLAVMRQENLF